jgi:hypothetical protein
MTTAGPAAVATVEDSAAAAGAAAVVTVEAVAAAGAAAAVTVEAVASAGAAAAAVAVEAVASADAAGRPSDVSPAPALGRYGENKFRHSNEDCPQHAGGGFISPAERCTLSAS